MNGACALIASVCLAAGAIASPCANATQQGDPTLALIREDDFLRGVSDFGLVHAFDDLERVDPAATAQDPATERLRAIARARITLRAPQSTMLERRNAFDQLRRARAELVAAYPRDARLPLWLVDAAEDEFVLGFLGLDGGAEAIAGSPLDGVTDRATASLARVRALLADAATANAAGAATPIPPDSALAARLSEDARGRLPFLRAAIDALALAIDRSSVDAVAQRERLAIAAPLHTAIAELRTRVPPRLKTEVDLAEVAAAATALRLEEARFGAARIALTHDPVLTTLSRVLVADGLVNERHGNEALQQLGGLHKSPELPTALRLLAADAFVRTRVIMGKSLADPQTLDAWIATLRTALPPERAAVRRAVLDRLAGALRGTTVTGSIPALALVARAGDAFLADQGDSGSESLLRTWSEQRVDFEAQAAALSVLADVYGAHGAWGRAADAYRLFAQCAAQEPTAATAIVAALDIEIALDSARPDARSESFESALRAALSGFPELPTRTRSEAQLLALEVIHRSDMLLTAPGRESADGAAEFRELGARLRDLQSAARAAGFDPGTRTTAAIQLAAIAADLLAPGEAASAPLPPTLEAWNAITQADARRVFRMRLHRAALRDTPLRESLHREFEGLSPTLLGEGGAHDCPPLAEFVWQQVGAAQRLRDVGDSSFTTLASAALIAAEEWEAIQPSAGKPAHDAASRSLYRAAADAALLAASWDAATTRARALAALSDADEGDLLRLATALSRAAHAKDQQGDAARRDALRTEAMEAARVLASSVARGSPSWWTAQVIQLELAQATGRAGEPLRARIARLRAFDPDLGGEAFRTLFEKLESTPPPAPAAAAPSH